MIDPSDGGEHSTIHKALLRGTVEYQGRELELKLSAGQHTLSGLVLDGNLTVSRLKITAAEGASLSSSASTLLEVRPGAPPVELHGLTLNGQVVIESSSTVDIAGCRFGSASARRRLQTSASERALMILGGSVTISDALFEGLPGGAIEVSGGDVSVHTTSFKENQAERGGALLVTGGELRVHNSTFTENEAEEGGALFIKSGKARVSNSTFTDNKANAGGAEGDAIRIIGPNATLELATLTQITGSEGYGGSIVSDVAWTFILPCRLGHYVSDPDQDGVAGNAAGSYLSDYPRACSATLRDSGHHKRIAHSYDTPLCVLPDSLPHPGAGSYCTLQGAARSPAWAFDPVLTSNPFTQVRQQLRRERSVSINLRRRLPRRLLLPTGNHRARPMLARHILPSEIGGANAMSCRDV